MACALRPLRSLYRRAAHRSGVKTGPMRHPTGTSRQDITHVWASGVDHAHIQLIRRQPRLYAPNGAVHLVLEVLAYAAEEAEQAGAGKAVVSLHPDMSVSISDNGRGTETDVGNRGQGLKKPVMSSRDIRFFDSPHPPLLPDGHPRRGMSVVAALSAWLVHTNRRRDGAWTQRYERGVAVTDLAPIPPDGTTGTTVQFLPDTSLMPDVEIPAREIRRLAVAFGHRLSIEFNDEPV
jgi:topoisomerase IV subunit B